MTIAKDFLRVGTFALLSIGTLFFVTACGGGGGGGSSSSPVTPSTSAPPATPPDTSIDPSDIGAGGTGQVTLEWTSSHVNTDGSCSSGLQGYRINVGLTPNYYDYSTTVEASDLSCSVVSMDDCGSVQRCTYTVRGLTSASWYLAVQSIDMYGNESNYSDQIVATVVN